MLYIILWRSFRPLVALKSILEFQFPDIIFTFYSLTLKVFFFFRHSWSSMPWWRPSLNWEARIFSSWPMLLMWLGCRDYCYLQYYFHQHCHFHQSLFLSCCCSSFFFLYCFVQRTIYAYKKQNTMTHGGVPYGTNADLLTKLYLSHLTRKSILAPTLASNGVSYGYTCLSERMFSEILMYTGRNTGIESFKFHTHETANCIQEPLDLFVKASFSYTVFQ